MTAKEAAVLEQLRTDLHSYHTEIKEHIVRCEGCRSEVAKMAADVYGLPGNKKDSPGLMGDVAAVKGSLRIIRLGLRGVWAIILLILGAAATVIAKSL